MQTHTHARTNKHTAAQHAAHMCASTPTSSRPSMPHSSKASTSAATSPTCPRDPRLKSLPSAAAAAADAAAAAGPSTPPARAPAGVQLPGSDVVASTTLQQSRRGSTRKMYCRDRSHARRDEGCCLRANANRQCCTRLYVLRTTAIRKGAYQSRGPRRPGQMTFFRTLPTRTSSERISTLPMTEKNVTQSIPWMTYPSDQ